VLPTAVRVEDVATAARIGGEPWLLPVGVAATTLGPAVLRLYEGEHALVAGPARSGRTTALASMARVARAVEPTVRVVIVGPGRSPLAALASPDQVLEPAAPAGPLADVATHEGPVLVLIDDADLVDDPVGALAALLAAPPPGLHVVVAGRNEALRSRYAHWSRAARSSRAGLLLQPDLDLDGDLIGTTLPRRTVVPLTPGRGFLVCGGALDVVQGTSLHEIHREVA
jgi:S-DNA-T family DNA segregation ATPase FtsK/SpoIIIE